MSFGFSVGDFILLGQITSKLRKDYQTAPAEFASLKANLDTFQGLIQQFQRYLNDRTSRLGRAKSWQLKQLESVMREIKGVLNSLESICERYQHVVSRRKVWDRMRFPREDVRHLQAQLQFYVTALNFHLEALSSEILGKVLQLLEEMVAQNKMERTNWELLLGALEEKGVLEADVTAHRTDIEEVVFAAQDVAQSERHLSPESSLRSSTGSSSGTSNDGPIRHDDNWSIGESLIQEEEHHYVFGPPTPGDLRSRVCPGAIKLQGLQGGYTLTKRSSKTHKYRMKCTDCGLHGYLKNVLDVKAPYTTTLHFSARQKALTPASLE